MKMNMGKTDRILRAFVVAPILILVALLGVGAGSVIGVILLVLAAVMVGTAAVGSCPLYAPFGFDTCPRRTAAS